MNAIERRHILKRLKSIEDSVINDDESQSNAIDDFLSDLELYCKTGNLDYFLRRTNYTCNDWKEYNRQNAKRHKK